MNGRTISDLWSGCSTGRFCRTRHTPNEAPWPKAPRSERDIFATRARGSCGVDPRLVQLRIVTFLASPMGDSLYGARKRLALDISADKRPGKKEFNVSIKFNSSLF